MKNIFLFTFLFITYIAGAQPVSLKLASDTWPPFTDTEEGKAIAMDLVEEALNRTGNKVLFTIMEFDDVIRSIDNGTVDGSAALWKSEEREQKYLFSEPYLQNQLVLVGIKNSDVNFDSFDDFDGVSIGIVEDYDYGIEVESDNVQLVYGENDQQNLERLLSGTIDYMLVDDLLIQYMLKYQVNDVNEFLEIADHPLLVKPLHFAINKDIEGGAGIIKAFNEEIREMIADGTYNKILELNWIRADLDGDGTMELIFQGDAAGTSPPEHIYGLQNGIVVATDPGIPERYYINGKFYNSWDQVPESYKTEIIMSTQDPNKVGIKLNF